MAPLPEDHLFTCARPQGHTPSHCTQGALAGRGEHWPQGLGDAHIPHPARRDSHLPREAWHPWLKLPAPKPTVKVIPRSWHAPVPDAAHAGTAAADAGQDWGPGDPASQGSAGRAAHQLREPKRTRHSCPPATLQGSALSWEGWAGGPQDFPVTLLSLLPSTGPQPRESRSTRKVSDPSLPPGLASMGTAWGAWSCLLWGCCCCLGAPARDTACSMRHPQAPQAHLGKQEVRKGA